MAATSMNPRYAAFLKTDLPKKSWEFMDFINKMKRQYLESKGDFTGPIMGQIEDHVEFTAFIEANYMNHGISIEKE